MRASKVAFLPSQTKVTLGADSTLPKCDKVSYLLQEFVQRKQMLQLRENLNQTITFRLKLTATRYNLALFPVYEKLIGCFLVQR